MDDIQRTGDGLMENLYDGGVVVGHSGHRGADDAVLVAARLAARLHLPLHVVHVIAVEDFPVDPDSLTDEADARSIAKQQSRAAVGLGRHPVLVVPEGTAQDLDEVRFGEPPPKAGPAV
ncbi:MAG: hypothetical protein K0S40_2485 [Actinomycetospora sp.]|nr:hypothetical protein [Actinomycetospora sp.]